MTVRYEKKDHIVLITIDRYEKRNAIDAAHSEQLVSHWKTFRDDPDAWVAIITGVKNAFCAGGDLNQMGQIAKEYAETGASSTQNRFTEQGGMTLRRWNIYKPIIAAVNGFCMAGGMELLGGTDLRIASKDAVFSVTEPRRGLFPGGGTTARLPRQIGWPAAMEVLLVAGNISAERAFQLGFVNEVVEREALMERAFEWAREITKNAPLAVQNVKKSALLGFQAGNIAEAYDIEDACGKEVFSTADAQEGARAFLEKRAPVWKGK